MKSETPAQLRHSPILLLLSDDAALADLVLRIAQPPWQLVRQGGDSCQSHKLFTVANVRLVLLDDQAVEENERNWLLTQIRRHFPAAALIYVAGRQSDGNEKRARTNGAHYYVSKPIAPDRFSHVLQSFLQAQQAKEAALVPAKERSAMSAKEPAVTTPDRIDPGIRRLAEELNREDSQLRSYLLDAALAGLRLTRNPESPELKRDAARLWAAIEPILAHHLEAEGSELLPWLDQQSPLAPEVGRKVREYHGQLRTLIGLIASSGKDDLTETEARQAGQALSGLAVCLDDAIDDEERRLFPTIRKALFGLAPRA